MHKNIIKSLGVALVCLTTSCDVNDYLEQPNPNAPTVDEFWQSTSNLNAGLNAVYNSFKSENNTMIIEEYNRSDINYPSYKRPLDKVYEYYFQSFTNASNLPKNKWASLYNGVFRANQVLEAYNQLKNGLSEEELEQSELIVAQAKALRGWFYFSLHNTFACGEIPLFDFVPKTLTDFQQPVSSSEEVLAFYRKDLEEAYEVLKLVDEKEYDTGRITAGACEAILGKSYLYAGDYTRAAQYFKSVIDNYSYALTDDLGSNFTTRDEFNEESILEVNYTTDLKFEFDGTEGLTNGLAYKLGNGGWNGGYPASWLTVAYKNDPVDPADPVNLVEDEEGVRLRKYSLRASYSIALVDDNAPAIGWYKKEHTAEVNGFGKGKPQFWRKHTNWEITDSEKNLFPGVTAKSGVNIRLIRLADVYLMYAECLLEGIRDTQGAMKYINRVRKRSHVVLLGHKSGAEFDNEFTTYDEVDYTEETLRKHLRHVERPLELAMEGNAIRTIDLRRWDVTKERFVEVASWKYNSNNFPKNANGTHGIKWRCILTSYELGDDDPESENYEPKWDSKLKDKVGVAFYNDNLFEDNTVAAVNYDKTKHAYLPIPLSEINSNLNLYKISE